MLTDALAHQILDDLLGTGATKLPGTVYIGLMTAAPNADGTGVVEPSGNGYARVAVTNNNAQWPAAALRSKTHANDIIFPTASGGWGTITHVGIFDAATAGNLKVSGALATPRAVLNTDIFRFLAGSSNLRLTL